MLANKVKSHWRDDVVDVGRARWVNHGLTSEENTHPHCLGDVYLVHNGIVENHRALREELSAHDFTSQTDSEVLAALIDNLHFCNSTINDAVARAPKLVEGIYGISVASM